MFLWRQAARVFCYCALAFTYLPEEIDDIYTVYDMVGRPEGRTRRRKKRSGRLTLVSFTAVALFFLYTYISISRRQSGKDVRVTLNKQTVTAYLVRNCPGVIYLQFWCLMINPVCVRGNWPSISVAVGAQMSRRVCFGFGFGKNIALWRRSQGGGGIRCAAVSHLGVCGDIAFFVWKARYGMASPNDLVFIHHGDRNIGAGDVCFSFTVCPMPHARSAAHPPQGNRCVLVSTSFCSHVTHTCGIGLARSYRSPAS